jgi:hypothetical protein
VTSSTRLLGTTGGTTLAGVAVKKRSIALDREVADAVVKAAKDEGVSVSAWLSEAARKQLKIHQGLAAIAEWEAEHGAPTAEELAQADAILEKHGLIPRRGARRPRMTRR